MNRRVKVLVVDDDETTRRVLQRILRDQLNCQVSLACSGEEAMRRLAVNGYELVLLDVLMPGMNGLQTLHRIRADSSREHLPVIAMTSTGDIELVTQMHPLRVRLYLIKPIQLDDLTTRLEPILTEIRGEQQPTADAGGA